MKSKKGLIITGSIILVLIIGAVIITLFMRNKNEENYLEWKFESTYTGETIEGVRDRDTFTGSVVIRSWIMGDSEKFNDSYFKSGYETKQVFIEHWENGKAIRLFIYNEERSEGDLETGKWWESLTFQREMKRLEGNTTQSIPDECDAMTELECLKFQNTTGNVYSWRDFRYFENEFILPNGEIFDFYEDIKLTK